MNIVIKKAFEEAENSIRQAGNMIPAVKVLEILEALENIVNQVDECEGGENAEYTEADVLWLDSLHDRGLTLSVTNANATTLCYTVYYNGTPCGMGKVSDEGLEDTARDIKIMKNIDAEHILQMLEENV